MYNNKPYHLLSLLAAAMIANSAGAETLEQAWTEALTHNHQLKAAQANTLASQQQLQAVEGQQLPSMNINSGYTQYSETPAAIAEIDGSSRTAMFNTSQAGSAQAQAVVTVPIFSSGRISHGIDAAEASLKASQENETVTALNLKMQVAEAYIDILRLESSLEVAKTQAASLRASMQDVSNLYEQGMVAHNDVLAAQVEVANAEQQIIKTDSQLQNACANYNQLLNRNLTDNVKLDPLPSIPKTSHNLAELNQQALTQRPELTSLALQAQALQNQAQSVTANSLPQINLNGGYQYQENRYQAYQGMWMANVSLQWKLFDGSTRHQSGSLNSQAIGLKEQADDLIKKIGLQVQQAWLDKQEAEQRIGVTEKAIDSADENLKISLDRYQQGLGTYTEVIKAQELRTTTYNNFNNARYDTWLANLRLQRAVGNL